MKIAYKNKQNNITKKFLQISPFERFLKTGTHLYTGILPTHATICCLVLADFMCKRSERKRKRWPLIAMLATLLISRPINMQMSMESSVGHKATCLGRDKLADILPRYVKSERLSAAEA